MKKVLVFSAAAVLLTLSAYQNVWSKAHVPVNKVQVCHDGTPVETITVSQNALQAHLNHGDCQLPVCDFANVVHTANSCNIVGAGGHCGGLAPRVDAGGSTPACSPGTF